MKTSTGTDLDYRSVRIGSGIVGLFGFFGGCACVVWFIANVVTYLNVPKIVNPDPPSLLGFLDSLTTPWIIAIFLLCLLCYGLGILLQALSEIMEKMGISEGGQGGKVD